MKSNLSNPWFIRKTGVMRSFRLYCFCYAGGSASTYLPWQAELGPDVEVCAIQLPGRGMRLLEQPYRTMEPLVEDITQSIANDSHIPFAFFGHSMGALVAFEVARNLARHQLTTPLHLFASGASAPQFRKSLGNLHTLPHDELVEALRAYNGTPPEVLKHRELMELLLPVVRADFEVIANYRYRPTELLHVPITVMAGKSEVFDRPEEVEEWARETTAACDIRWFDGGHFFIMPQRSAVLECISGIIDQLSNKPSVLFR
jgi:medium-chain acyl-[acyl-carrier-protein] hydrolase